MTEVAMLVRRLREEPGLSRNRNFDELAQPMAERARRIQKRLAGIEREMRAASTVALTRTGADYLLTLEFPPLRARRITRLSADEHALLSLDEALRAMLQSGAADGVPPGEADANPTIRSGRQVGSD